MDNGGEVLIISLNDFNGNDTSFFLRYALTRYSAFQRELAYRFYIAESLRLIGKGNGYIENHLHDIIFPKKSAFSADVSGEELVAEIAKNIGLEVI